MGGTCAVREEPGKQKTRSCRTQELARSSPQESERRKKAGLLNWKIGRISAKASGHVKRNRKSQQCHDHHRFENGARFEWLLCFARGLKVRQRARPLSRASTMINVRGRGTFSSFVAVRRTMS